MDKLNVLTNLMESLSLGEGTYNIDIITHRMKILNIQDKLNQKMGLGRCDKIVKISENIDGLTDLFDTLSVNCKYVNKNDSSNKYLEKCANNKGGKSDKVENVNKIDQLSNLISNFSKMTITKKQVKLKRKDGKVFRFHFLGNCRLEYKMFKHHRPNWLK
jgi:hypothetical protein